MSQVDETPPSRKPLPTVWHVPDPLWDKILGPLLAEFDPPKKKGRPRAHQRKCLDGIIYRARTGCQWNQLPKDLGDDATVHRTLQRWESLGLFDRLWALLLYHCEELGGVHWEWQAADGCLNKARFIDGRSKGGIKRAGQRVGRRAEAGKAGSRGRQEPRGPWEAGRQGQPACRGRGRPACCRDRRSPCEDHLLLAATLDALVVERPQPSATQRSSPAASFSGQGL